MCRSAFAALHSCAPHLTGVLADSLRYCAPWLPLPPPQVDSITIPVGPRLGGKVVEVDQLRKGFGDRLLLDGATFSIPPGGITATVTVSAIVVTHCCYMFCVTLGHCLGWTRSYSPCGSRTHPWAPCCLRHSHTGPAAAGLGNAPQTSHQAATQSAPTSAKKSTVANNKKTSSVMRV